MNAQLLIDSIVRQTTVLVAQLATSRGLRAPLAHLADQVFLELAAELEAQGLSRKVTADMFGMALRSYRRRVQRLTESSTERGRSLWEAVLDFLASSQAVTRARVLERFHRDEEATVRAILNDLCESGLVFQLGRGPTSVYRAATPAELQLAADQGLGLVEETRSSRRVSSKCRGRTECRVPHRAGFDAPLKAQRGAANPARTWGARYLDELLWLLIYREGPLSLEQAAQKLRSESEPVRAALDRLVQEQRVVAAESGQYHSSQLVLMLDAEAGWEGAMLDHYQSVVRTLCARLRGEGAAASTGGSTYSFDVWPSHPLAAEVKAALARLRGQLGELWDRVEAHNRAHGLPPEYERVTVYAGQSSLMQQLPCRSEGEGAAEGNHE